MPNTLLFPFSEAYGFYIAFLAGVMLLLALDLGIFHRKERVPGVGSSIGWSLFWTALALGFGAILYHLVLDKTGSGEMAKEIGLQYLTGFLIEKSLALDNLFLFVLIFGALGIPASLQHRVLFYGILGALFFRVVFIAAGSWLMQFHAVVIGFGLLLAFTGIKVLLSKREQGDPRKGWVYRLLQRWIPFTPDFDGQKFLVRREGRVLATPLLAALMLIEASDILFAVDSVPAIFAITDEPFVVLTSNVFAILGLRSLYFAIAGALLKLRFLSYGLGILLLFVGAKMTFLNALFGGKFPVTWSLAIISGVLSITALASWIWPLRSAAPSVPDGHK